MSNLGMGVMLGYLGGNEETVNNYHKLKNKQIKKIWLDKVLDCLFIETEHSGKFKIFDDGQSCCEERYMQTDDDLSYYKNCTLMDIEIKESKPVENDYETHEIQFLEIKTSKGVFQIANHNIHNGYYGGFWIIIEEVK